ncbi:MAG: CRISPR-associated endonuclease Cas1, partial [Anaerolineae bacterium]|nr:CRISPR-associated endonuclease Cas1 [Anaerolineae bacterium]
MPSLYVVEQGSMLTVEQRRLLVTGVSGRRIAQVPLAHTSAVILFGNVCLSTPAMKRLLRAGIDVIFLTRRGRYVGRLVGPLTRFGLLRQRQYEGACDAAFCLPIAQAIIRAKCLNMRTLLMRYQRAAPHPDLADS